MKKIFFYASLLVAMTAILVTSCKEDKDFITARHYISVAKLREMYQGQTLNLTGKDKGGELYIGGVVISNPAHGNVPENKVIIQNFADGVLRGIALSIPQQANRYQAGDSVIAKIEGGKLERVDGILQVSGITVLDIGRMSINNEQKVHITTNKFAPVLTARDTYESTLVSILDVEVDDLVRGQTFGAGDLKLNDGENNMYIKTRTTASFAASEVPVSGSFKGILFYNDAQQPYLSIRSNADYTGVFMAPENYTGFPETWETVIGTRKTGQGTDGYDQYVSGRWFLQKAFVHNAATLINKNGTWTAMLASSNVSTETSVAMDFDLDFGASEFSFVCGAATAAVADANPVIAYAEYSGDSGATWNPVDAANPGFAVTSQSTKYTVRYSNLTIKGKVRFRVRKNASTSRITIDDIFIKPNGN